MDFNKLHDEALANASKNQSALDNALKCSSTAGQRGKDPISSYEKKQDEDVMRSAIAALFENLISKSGNAIASDWRADYRMVESVHFYYYKYYSSSPVLFVVLGLLAFLVGTSKLFLWAFVPTLVAVLMLVSSNPKVFFEIYTRHLRVSSEFKNIVFQNIFKNNIDFKNVAILSTVATIFSFVFLKLQFAVFGFNLGFLWAYNPNFEMYGLMNAVACLTVGYAKLSERWA